MILIATRKEDSSTDDVIDWIIGKGGKVVRVGANNPLSDINISSDIEAFIQINDKKIFLKDIDALWHRKGDGFFIDFPIDSLQLDHDNFDLPEKLKQEWKIVREYIYFLLSKKKNLGNYAQRSLNKLITHHWAKEAGLQIPYSLIVTSKQEALKVDLEVITKAIAEVVAIPLNEVVYGSYTTDLTQDFMKKLPNNFFPALLQEKLHKKYELRVFYLNGKCYSMAIFSQMDQQTQVDFRVYNLKKPNRSVPYQLPEELESKIHTLMQSVQLNTGSLDFVVTKDHDYYFLEINPIGQFGMVSKPCNYYLEKKIAEYLLDN